MGRLKRERKRQRERARERERIVTKAIFFKKYMWEIERESDPSYRRLEGIKNEKKNRNRKIKNREIQRKREE